jgi:hypothetical protein
LIAPSSTYYDYALATPLVTRGASFHDNNLPDPDVLAEEIAENLESALDAFKNIIEQLKQKN